MDNIFELLKNTNLLELRDSSILEKDQRKKILLNKMYDYEIKNRAK